MCASKGAKHERNLLHCPSPVFFWGCLDMTVLWCIKLTQFGNRGAAISGQLRFAIPHSSVAQRLPCPGSDAVGPSSNIEHRHSPEVLRHMLVSPMAVLVSTAGRLLSVDSARLTERLVREFNIQLIKAQWWQKKALKIK